MHDICSSQQEFLQVECTQSKATKENVTREHISGIRPNHEDREGAQSLNWLLSSAWDEQNLVGREEKTTGHRSQFVANLPQIAHLHLSILSDIGPI